MFSIASFLLYAISLFLVYWKPAFVHPSLAMVFDVMYVLLLFSFGDWMLLERSGYSPFLHLCKGIRCVLQGFANILHALMYPFSNDSRHYLYNYQFWANRKYVYHFQKQIRENVDKLLRYGAGPAAEYLRTVGVSPNTPFEDINIHQLRDAAMLYMYQEIDDFYYPF